MGSGRIGNWNGERGTGTDGEAWEHKGEFRENKMQRKLCRGSCLYLCGVRVRYIPELFLLEKAMASGLFCFRSLSLLLLVVFFILF